MFRYIFLILLSFLAILSSCQRFVDIDLQGKSQMVVSCFLSPDQSEISLRLLQNQQIGTSGGFSPGDFIISDATVSIENLSQARTLALVFVPEEGRYRSAKPDSFLQAGDEYRLRIQHPDFPEVTGQCQIPEAPQNFVVRLDSVSDDQIFPDFFVQPTWEDPLGERNYYRLIGQVIPDTTFIRKDPWYFRWRGLTSDPDYITDEEVEEGTIQGPLGDLQTVAEQVNGVVPPRMPGDSVRVALLQIDEAYYRYMLDLRQSRDVDLTFSEPYRVYTNLEGGLGIFAAYHADERRLRIR